MLAKRDVESRKIDAQRVREIEQNLHGFVQLGKLSTREVVRLAALALAESEHDLIMARSAATLLRRQLLRERRKSSCRK
jgi:hypothetical protein